MSFHLLDTLNLEEGKTGNVALVPTKQYFKPVIALNAPLTQDTAKLIGAAWAFDEFGNPQKFEGSIKLLIELDRAIVTLTGKASGDIRFLAETVKHFSVFVEEKTGMRLNLRVHLPENKEQLYELLDFLSKLNKDEFVIRVEPESLLAGTSEEAPQTAGAAEFPFRIEGSRNRPACIGSIKTMPTGGGFIASWEFKGIGMTGSPSGGQAANDDSSVFTSEASARDWAADELLSFVKYKLTPSAKEVAWMAKMVDWILDLAPALRREEKTPLIPIDSKASTKVQ